MTPRIAAHIMATDGYTSEEKRIAYLKRKYRRMWPGDGSLLTTERHPAIVENRTPLSASIGELVG